MLEARKNQLDALLDALEISRPEHPESYEMISQALTHSSFTYENNLSNLENYERLEFLGDAVLKLVVSEYLFERFPQYREGELTKIRAVVVSDNNLAKLATDIKLGETMIFGTSELKSGGPRKVSNLACGFEAFLGALFLDGRMPEIQAFLYRLLEDTVTQIDMSKTKDNFKAVLQELTQAQGFGLPVYKTVDEKGPSHNKTFFIEAYVNGELLGHGSGKSKKEAQQSAAKMALDSLNELEE